MLRASNDLRGDGFEPRTLHVSQMKATPTTIGRILSGRLRVPETPTPYQRKEEQSMPPIASCFHSSSRVVSTSAGKCQAAKCGRPLPGPLVHKAILQTWNAQIDPLGSGSCYPTKDKLYGWGVGVGYVGLDSTRYPSAVIVAEYCHGCLGWIEGHCRARPQHAIQWKYMWLMMRVFPMIFFSLSTLLVFQKNNK